MIHDQLLAAVQAALDACGFPAPPDGIELTAPKDPGHGDFTTNVAMQLARTVGQSPREIAAKLVEELERARAGHLARVEIAGPGFLNLHLDPGWLHEVLLAVVAQGEAYGHGDALDGLRINLEFVSANPTGPLHAGGGRWVAVGDALANLLAAQGAVVHREYYLNDAGNQLDMFAASLFARYEGRKPPEDGYQGQYLIDMAVVMRDELGDAVTEEQALDWGYRYNVRTLQDDLARIGVLFDTWFSERALHDAGNVKRVLD
ncbi:MAG TPA: arginine--tRNA ligase, partial [Acidimicrobiia bacterium]|nr:arginine--tRNA ligase [Acidimicrobiia bacterium]